MLGQIAFYVEVLALVALAGMLFRQVRNRAALPAPLETRMARGRPLPPLSVVVPVVDDQDDLQTCLAALSAQEYPELDVIVVDARDVRRNQRADLLPMEFAGAPGIRVLRSDPAPGWTRRNHALDAGAAASKTDWVLFLDPTVYLKEDGLVRAVGTAVWHDAEVVTWIPGLTATVVGERLLVTFLAQLAMAVLPVREILDPDDPTVPAHAFSLLFRRAAYARVRRSRSLWSEGFYEVAVARRLKAAGQKLHFTRGAELAILRMPHGLEAIWWGWARSFTRAVEGDSRRALGAALALLVVFTVPWLLVALAPVMLIAGTTPAASSAWTGVLLAGSAHVLLSLTMRRWLRDAFRIDDSMAWLQPVAAAITAAMLVASTVRLSGRLGSWLRRLGLVLETRVGSAG